MVAGLNHKVIFRLPRRGSGEELQIMDIRYEMCAIAG